MPHRLTADRSTVRRAWAGALLAVAVTLLHLLATHLVGQRVAAWHDAATMPTRVEVAYVRTLEPEAPTPVAVAPTVATPPATPRAPRSVARAVAPAASPPRERASAPDATAAAWADAASAAAPSAPASDPPAAAASIASDPAVSQLAAAASASSSTPSTASTPAASEPLDVAAAASAAGRAGFAWPQATRVSYRLTGYYRGDVQGHAEVEWIRQGDRYQVNVDLVVGPAVAPILKRLATSEGRLTAEGLAPDRYAESTTVLFRKPRTQQVTLGTSDVLLANGQTRPRPAGVQDGASQFIQFTWLFGMQPELLRTGRSFEIPLALTRNVDRWRYDVVGEEALATPFGPLATFHLKPVRTTRRPSEIAVEMWLAPELRHLPVRIRFEQDADTFLDLVIARKPELSG